MIREMIFAAPNMLLLRATESPTDNLRSAYEMALIHDDLQPDKVEAPEEMFKRTGAFIWAVIEALDQIAAGFGDRTGMTGGATGAASIGDIRHLTEPDAKELFDITFARREAETFKKDVIGELIKWSAANPLPKTEDGSP